MMMDKIDNGTPQLTLHAAGMAFEQLSGDLEEAAAACFLISRTDDLDPIYRNGIAAMHTLLCAIAAKVETEAARFYETHRIEQVVT